MVPARHGGRASRAGAVRGCRGGHRGENAVWSFTLGRSAAVEPLEPLKASFDQGPRQLQTQVPPGHSIYVDVPDSNSAWAQRVPEFAAIRGLTVASDRAQADYVVTVEWIPGGVRLTARPTR